MTTKLLIIAILINFDILLHVTLLTAVYKGTETVLLYLS